LGGLVGLGFVVEFDGFYGFVGLVGVGFVVEFDGFYGFVG